ncbi:hypothetical protein Nmel_018822, partial [Mimus melanotis]
PAPHRAVTTQSLCWDRCPSSPGSGRVPGERHAPRAARNPAGMKSPGFRAGSFTRRWTVLMSHCSIPPQSCCSELVLPRKSQSHPRAPSRPEIKHPKSRDIP